MADVLAAMLAALDKADAPPLEGPSANNPFRPIPVRPERRGQRAAHRDPTGDRAVGRIRKKEKS